MCYRWTVMAASQILQDLTGIENGIGSHCIFKDAGTIRVLPNSCMRKSFPMHLIALIIYVLPNIRQADEEINQTSTK